MDTSGTETLAPSVRRVLMTADAVGGVWTYAVDLSRGLAGRGIEVLLAVLGPAPTSAQLQDLAGTLRVSVAQWHGRLEWMDNPWPDVEAGRPVAARPRSPLSAPDVVHLNGFCHGHLPWSAPVLMAGHSCVRSWWHAVKGERPPRRFDGYTAAVREGLAAADLVVAPSRAMLDALRQHYGPLSRTRVIPNGRPDGGGRPWRGKEPLVLTAGRLWDEAKNVLAVDAVAPRLPWPVHVAGDTQGAVRCAHAHLLGPLSASELARWMDRASIYVLPARYEPFGLSVLEAAQARCALVLGDLPSLREIWQDAACYVGPGDREALASTIRLLIAEPDRLNEMAARAHERASQFTAERMIAGYRAAYQELFADPMRALPSTRIAVVALT